MKQTFCSILALAAAGVICSLVTCRIAYHRGFVSGYRQGSVAGLTAGDFTESLLLLVPLQKLRAGDDPGATRYLETNCFGRANAFFKFSTPVAGPTGQWIKTEGLLQPPGTEMARTLAKALSEYRAVYRANSADWDDAERQLESQITRIKSDDYKAWSSIVVMPTAAAPSNSTKP